MPELPEVETVRKALLLKLKGKKIKDLKVIHKNVFVNKRGNDRKKGNHQHPGSG